MNSNDEKPKPESEPISTPQFPNDRIELNIKPEIPNFPTDRIEKGEKQDDGTE